jgi:hypothetical protein
MHIRRIGANCIAFDDSIDEIIAHGATFREGKIRQNSVGVTFPEGSRCMTTNRNATMMIIIMHRHRNDYRRVGAYRIRPQRTATSQQ